MPRRRRPGGSSPPRRRGPPGRAGPPPGGPPPGRAAGSPRPGLGPGPPRPAVGAPPGAPHLYQAGHDGGAEVVQLRDEGLWEADDAGDDVADRAHLAGALAGLPRLLDALDEPADAAHPEAA